MSAFATLTLKDSAAANIVLTPSAIDGNGVAKWFGNESVFDAKRQATMQVTVPRNGGTVARVKQKFVQPVMDAVDATKKAGDCYVNIEFVFSKSATSTQRLDVLAAAKEFLANAVTTAAVTNLESIY